MGVNISEVHGDSTIRSLFLEGLTSVDPAASVRSTLNVQGDRLLAGGVATPIPAAGVLVIAVGKAAVPMARTAIDVLDGRTAGALALTKAGAVYDEIPAGFVVLEAAHPIPDQRGVAATRRILDLVAALTPDDIVLMLISGGGSALFEAPRPPVSLADLRAITAMLLRAGAPIEDLNGVRSELSLVKGGGLRAAIGPATCISLILSDVLGNDPAVIASGPTMLREPDVGNAWSIIDRYGLRDRLPGSVTEALGDPSRSQIGRTVSIDRDGWAVVGDNSSLLSAIQRAAEASGLKVARSPTTLEGEARHAARQFVAFCDQQEDDVDVVIAGGECTVTVIGEGRGGRNTEFATAAAIDLSAHQRRWTIASLASDGDDGIADAAGAIVDRHTVALGRAIGLDAESALDDNDTATYLARLDRLVITGQTGTNVNDVYIGLRER